MYGVFRVYKSGKLSYRPRSATANRKLAEEIADDLSNGVVVLPDGSTRRVRPYPHIAKEIVK